jgi:hypothetical protein
MTDPVGLLIRAVTAVLIFFAEIIGNCINALWTGALRTHQSGGFTKSRNPTKTELAEQEENRRLAGCEEIVVTYANALGYIAREAIKREEIGEMIDHGIQPDQLKAAIDRRIATVPGIILGVYP